MENKAHAVAAGLFLLVFGVAVAAVLWWFSNDREPTRQLVLVSDGNITGLNLQAQVRYRGMRAGKVEDITMDPDNPRQILVRISLREGLPVTQGTRASLGYQGVTGIAFVQLSDRGLDPGPLPIGPDGLARIALQPSLMEQLTDSGLEVVQRLQVMANRINGILSEGNQQRLASTLAHLDSAAQGMDRTFREAPRALASVRQALSPANLARLDSLLLRLDAAAGEAGPAVIELRSLVARLKGTSEQLERSVGSAGRGVSDDTLPRLNALLEDLAGTARRVNQLVEDIETSPQVLFFGQGQGAPGPGEAGFSGQGMEPAR